MIAPLFANLCRHYSLPSTPHQPCHPSQPSPEDRALALRISLTVSPSRETVLLISSLFPPGGLIPCRAISFAQEFTAFLLAIPPGGFIILWPCGSSAQELFFPSPSLALPFPFSFPFPPRSLDLPLPLSALTKVPLASESSFASRRAI